MIARAARSQEIFLDLVGLYTANRRFHTKFLLDPRFDSILTLEDKTFKESILRYVRETIAMEEAG